MPPRRERPQPRAPYPPRAGAARPPRPRPRWLVGALAGAVFGGAAASVPTYVVPGGSVFGAFHDLLELVSSAYPLGVGGGPPPPGGRRAADASDAAGVPPPSAALHDATLSTYARGKLAARLASSLRGADGGASDVPARRRLVGGAPVPSSGASAPAALFCDAHGLNATVPPRHWRRFPDDGCLHGRWLSAAGGGSAVPAAGGSADPADAPPFTFPIAWPFTALPVEEWCTLARLQPAVLAGFGVGDPKTLLLPDAGAFLELAERFPAWYEWVASLPGCVSSLNRAAALLQLVRAGDGGARWGWGGGGGAAATRLASSPCVAHSAPMQHASWRRIDCSTPRGNCSAVDFPSALLPRVGAAYYYAGRDVDARPFVTSEKLTIGRVVNASGGCVRARAASGARGPHKFTGRRVMLNYGRALHLIPAACLPPAPAPPCSVTCLVDTRRRFTFDPHVSPAVTAQFLGRDGNILVRPAASPGVQRVRGENRAVWWAPRCRSHYPPPTSSAPPPQLLDRVLSPRNEPLLRFPTASALDLLLGHPQLTNFSRLVVSSGLAPFFALGPLFSEQLLSALGADPPVLARVCAAALGAAVPTRACIAVLRFLHTSFHSVTLFAPLDAAFARLPPGVADFLADPANVDLARHVVLVRDQGGGMGWGGVAWWGRGGGGSTGRRSAPDGASGCVAAAFLHPSHRSRPLCPPRLPTTT